MAFFQIVAGGASDWSLDESRDQLEIQYGSLTMSPHPTFAERDNANDAAARKAQAYQADSSLRLFIESDDLQARQIAQLTGRPVFSVARNGLVCRPNPTSFANVVGVPPRTRISTAVPRLSGDATLFSVSVR